MPRWAQPKEEVISRGAREPRPTVVLVVGGPGAGKSTICKRIANEFKYVHLSVGSLLREEGTRPGSDVRDVINEHLMAGTLVPSEVTVDVVLRAIQREEDWKHSKFLIDSFPKDLSQIAAFNEIIGNKVVMKVCLFLDCSEANMEKRLLARADAENACDDNTLDAIKSRIAKGPKGVFDVQRHFQYEGLLERIDANRDIAKVWADVQTFFVVQVYRDQHDGDATCGSPAKSIWKLREKQCQELFPTGNSHTSTTYVKGEHARGFSSYGILAKHREKHTRNMKAPMDNFLEPMTLAQEIGWHQADDGQHIGVKGTPRGGTTPRSFYPKNTCSMTRHMENMYSTNAQHIIRRW